MYVIGIIVVLVGGIWFLIARSKKRLAANPKGWQVPAAILGGGGVLLILGIVCSVTGAASHKRGRVVATGDSTQQLESTVPDEESLPEEKRKEIWEEMVSLNMKMRRQVLDKHANLVDPTKLKAGQTFLTWEEINLMPELDPVDPLEAMKDVRRLSSKSTIKVLKVTNDNSGAKWYFVEATDSSENFLGSGWINSIALLGHDRIEMEQFEDSLKQYYRNVVLEKYEITGIQLDAIMAEGKAENW